MESVRPMAATLMSTDVLQFTWYFYIEKWSVNFLMLSYMGIYCVIEPAKVFIVIRYEVQCKW